MHEIVSLQFGQQSNYVGQHFWNTQESYFTYGGEEESPVDHDVNFRQGRAPDGSDTYTPRAVIYDLKGAFGTLRKTNALYEVGEDQEWDRSLWGGKRTVHRSDPIPPSEYQQHLDAGTEPPPLTTSTVRFWSDYARLYYHPKSLIQLHEHSVHDRIAPFEKWDVGEELFNTLDKEHDLLDRDLRPFVEECDHMQGFQVVASVDGAWGGFATRYTERIRDEYGKKGIWVWGTEEGGTRSKVRTIDWFSFLCIRDYMRRALDVYFGKWHNQADVTSGQASGLGVYSHGQCHCAESIISIVRREFAMAHVCPAGCGS
ncbi:tubulin domain-containing protein [Lineolata rhizophorae]|uniref:Tubulin domain-containing protein n=1 Tax=Lineolata rhizophorae TaxID=578093 RepID=A0A6A6PD08_9PEZI|nr:tubulin domain-containing protein [Lineolata rhizophorae]